MGVSCDVPIQPTLCFASSTEARQFTKAKWPPGCWPPITTTGCVPGGANLRQATKSRWNFGKKTCILKKHQLSNICYMFITVYSSDWKGEQQRERLVFLILHDALMNYTDAWFCPTVVEVQNKRIVFQGSVFHVPRYPWMDLSLEHYVLCRVFIWRCYEATTQQYLTLNSRGQRFAKVLQ